jgi:hypothetical protein
MKRNILTFNRETGIKPRVNADVHELTRTKKYARSSKPGSRADHHFNW